MPAFDFKYKNYLILYRGNFTQSSRSKTEKTMNVNKSK